MRAQSTPRKAVDSGSNSDTRLESVKGPTANRKIEQRIKSSIYSYVWKKMMDNKTEFVGNLEPMFYILCITATSVFHWELHQCHTVGHFDAAAWCFTACHMVFHCAIYQCFLPHSVSLGGI